MVFLPFLAVDNNNTSDILHIVIRGGEASNRGTQPADFVEIAATFYDAIKIHSEPITYS